MECQLCHSLSPTLKLYISHLRLVHQTDSNFSVTCSIGGCTKTFLTFPAYNSHIYRYHRTALGLLPKYSDSQAVPTDEREESPQLPVLDFDIPCSPPSDLAEPTVPELNLTNEELDVSEQAKFLLMLREEKHVSQVAISSIIVQCRKLCEKTFTNTISKVKRVLSNAEVDVPGLSDILEGSTPDYFNGIDTSYLLEEFARKHMNYVEPQEVILGESYFTNTMSGAKRRKVTARKKFYYVPLLETLGKLLGHADYIAEVLNPHKSSTSTLNDFCDGETFRTHTLFSLDPYALQVVAYYDELEVVNPIGTYVKKHKLGCLFFTLANVRPQFRSVLKAINLVAVVKCEDIKDENIGIDSFLAPFVNDLKRLYCDGITLSIGSEKRTFYGGLVAFLADNLAAHLLGGFKESMSFALRICRTCYITRNLSQTCLTEASCTLRTPESHYEHTQLLNGPLKSHYSTTYGIYRLSVLEEIPEFSVVNGIHHDIMHDLFEGVLPYELKLLLHHCIQSKYFTLQLFNERLQQYDFSRDKPTQIDERVLNSPDRKIRQSASQMMTMSRELPMIIGDKVKEDDKNWEAFLVLLRICQFVVSPCISPDSVEYLRQLIEEKLILFKQLYPNETLIPKQHFMLHYPAQILRSGPLLHSWTMRHEAKLSFVKRASRRGNFKNVCLTASKKHQLWQCWQLQNENLLHCESEFSPKRTESTYEEEENHVQLVLSRLFPNEVSNLTVYHHTWAKVQSSKYTKGVFVLIKYDLVNPEFGKVLDIIIVNNTVILSLQKYVSLFFDAHYNAYVVRSIDELLGVEQHILEWHNVIYPRTTFVSSDSHCYVTLPYMY